MLGKPLAELSAKPGFEQKKSFRRAGIKSNYEAQRKWWLDKGLGIE